MASDAREEDDRLADEGLAAIARDHGPRPRLGLAFPERRPRLERPVPPAGAW